MARAAASPAPISSHELATLPRSDASRRPRTRGPPQSSRGARDDRPPRRHDCRQVAAGRPAADGDGLAGDAVALGLGDEPGERRVAVVDPGGKPVLGRQSVLDRGDQASGIESAARQQAVHQGVPHGTHDRLESTRFPSPPSRVLALTCDEPGSGVVSAVPRDRNRVRPGRLPVPEFFLMPRRTSRRDLEAALANAHGQLRRHERELQMPREEANVLREAAETLIHHARQGTLRLRPRAPRQIPGPTDLSDYRYRSLELLRLGPS